ncbi:hypothetical protein [Prescottella agglutinans]|uniref:Secreted protein n=1 Tax=Prescottella agglutinans TaxID=1644129 RepID=A0ABT6MIZ3_9NOCA|nr:hypothetical protein [Prescottella agglutinans]MDH6284257.1 hypothetical protein [Prescottella agglutinans]
MRTVAQWLWRFRVLVGCIVAAVAMGVAARAAANAHEEPATRLGCTVSAINEPASPKHATLVKTSCGGMRSPYRGVTDSLRIGTTYDFQVRERSTWFSRTTKINTARPSR